MASEGPAGLAAGLAAGFAGGFGFGLGCGFAGGFGAGGGSAIAQGETRALTHKAITRLMMWIFISR